ncbi:hypothetical protein [Methylobacterium nigriterrae]|uniref:hypothetical protein n=1 Tax=Methylobacterium nigriterrae TaxID=3127512 RepID=UPI00301330C1
MAMTGRFWFCKPWCGRLILLVEGQRPKSTLKIIILNLSVMLLTSSAGNLRAAEFLLGSGGQGIDLTVIKFSDEWKVYQTNDKLYLRYTFYKSIAGVSDNKTTNWNVSSGGCAQLVPDFVPYRDPVNALHVRVDACAGAIQCVGGQQRLKIEAYYRWSYRAEAHIVGDVNIGGGIGLIDEKRAAAIDQEFVPELSKPKCSSGSFRDHIREEILRYR